MDKVLRFSEWHEEIRNRKDSSKGSDELFRHAMVIPDDRKLPDRLWPIVFRYCARNVGVFLLKVTESMSFKWTDKKLKVISELADYEYEYGIGAQVEVPSRPVDEITREAYELYLIDLLESEKSDHNRTKHYLEEELNSVKEKLYQLGWMYCGHCGKFVQLPHDPCPNE